MTSDSSSKDQRAVFVSQCEIYRLFVIIGPGVCVGVYLFVQWAGEGVSYPHQFRDTQVAIELVIPLWTPTPETHNHTSESHTQTFVRTSTSI